MYRSRSHGAAGTGSLTRVNIVSLDLGLGPEPHVLALSEFVLVPGPGVVLVDLNGQGMLYSETVWMDEAGRVSASGFGSSGTGWSISDGAVSVTGRARGAGRVLVEVTTSVAAASMSFEVTPESDGWYAGCRSLPEDWPDHDDPFVSVNERD
jgi:hypothetical protein